MGEGNAEIGMLSIKNEKLGEFLNPGKSLSPQDQLIFGGLYHLGNDYRAHDSFKNMLGFQKAVSGDWLDKGNEEKDRVMITIKHDLQDFYL